MSTSPFPTRKLIWLITAAWLLYITIKIGIQIIWAAKVTDAQLSGIPVLLPLIFSIPWLLYALVLVKITALSHLPGTRRFSLLGQWRVQSIAVHFAMAFMLVILHTAFVSSILRMINYAGANEVRYVLLAYDVFLNFFVANLLVAFVMMLALQINFYLAAARYAHVPVEAASQKKEPLRFISRGITTVIHEDDIQWIAAAGNYVEIYSGEKPTLVRANIGQIEKCLTEITFFRIHRSFITNIHYIRQLDTGKGKPSVVMIDGTRLPVSRQRISTLKDRLIGSNTN